MGSDLDPGSSLLCGFQFGEMEATHKCNGVSRSEMKNNLLKTIDYADFKLDGIMMHHLKCKEMEFE